MTGAARFGLGVSGGPSGPLGGGMGGGFGGFGKLHEMGFFGRWPYFLQPMEPAPAAPTAIPPAPGDVRPNAVARGAGGFGGKTSVAPKSNDLVRRSATFPKITIEDRIPSEPALPLPGHGRRWIGPGCAHGTVRR